MTPQAATSSQSTASAAGASRPPYTANATAAEIAARLSATKRFIVTTHAKPDGDALGSTLAIARALARHGAQGEVWVVGPWPRWMPQIAADTPLRKVSADAPDVSLSAPIDTTIITDTGSWSQLDGLKDWLATRADQTLIIDHHLHGDASIASLRYIDTSAAAVTELCAEVIEHLLGLDVLDGFPPEIAEPLYLGLATDTGWFKYSNVTPDTLALASRLLASGVNHARLYQLTEQTDDPSRPRLLGKALSSLEFHADGRIALMCLRQSDFDATGARTEDTGGFAESVMAVAGVSVVCTLTEMSRPGQPTQLTKGSLRSKPGPHAIDVAAVTATLGGGGHARAAGVKLAMPIEQARAAVLQALSAACASAHAATPGT